MLDASPGVDNADPAVTTAYLAAFSRGLKAGRFIRRVEGGASWKPLEPCFDDPGFDRVNRFRSSAADLNLSRETV